MKVLFAVSNEEISESVVKKYQKEYKQIISYKNVYYFNAILKELQKDKSYDRIVISEDLEAFTHTQYDQIDKFIFDKLDNISDEASDMKGNDIPIIVVSSDRRAKSEQILVKFFGIGIYNVIIGNDRSVDEVCKLINRPRVKKEAKIYYKIDSEEVNYQSESENDVSEMEIQNILAHYKRLGKSEERYIDSFNNIAAQYNDTQLRIISKFLPLNVRAVLEEKSTKYQQIMSFNNTVSDLLRAKEKKENTQGPSETLLKPKDKDVILSKPVVIPSAVNMGGTKKLSKSKPVEPKIVEPEHMEIDEMFEDLNEISTNNKIIEQEEVIEEIETVVQQASKRGRGRPRKNSVQETEALQAVKKRGRPRKNVEENEEETLLPGFEDEQEEAILPGVEEDFIKNEQEDYTNMNMLPGLEEENEEETFLPGFEMEEDVTNRNETEQENYNKFDNISNNQNNYINTKIENYEQTIDLSSLLTPDKKIASFVGTSKNGTSFIINNIAELISSLGVKTAILDTTQNRNSYYIYTKNEEQLRNIASKSIKELTLGMANGIQVNQNLAVYTSLPDESEEIYEVDKILETLVKNYSLVLIDTDFSTPIGYFKQSQETYLVQTMDVLTIQPLTAFLRELKAKNILDEKKLKVVLNKVVKIRGVKDETIIGGMAYYNDPAMSFMTELFDRDRIKYVSIPFEEETYIKYLESVIQCEISLKGYSKGFMQTLNELGNIVYPTKIQGKNNVAYKPPSVENNISNSFSSDMNNTLNRMKKNY